MGRRFSGLSVVLALVATLVVASGGRASAAPFVVQNNADGGSGSFREAVAGANATPGADTITFAPSVTGDIELTSGRITITDALTITGPGARLLAIDGNDHPSGVFFTGTIPNDRNMLIEMSGFTIKGGLANRSNPFHAGGISNFANLVLRRMVINGNLGHGFGGGIHNNTNLTIIDSMISNNFACACGSGLASFGGGLSSFGSTTIRNSTFYGNNLVNMDSGLVGGGIYVGDGTTTISNSTIAQNAGGAGGGIYVDPGAFAYMSNSILAFNLLLQAAPNGRDCAGTLTSRGYNLVSDMKDCGFVPTTGDKFAPVGQFVDPMISAPPGNHGGQTDTMRLLPGSPAIDAGNPATPLDGALSGGLRRCEATDQRGVSRPLRQRCDMGAFEASATLRVNTGSLGSGADGAAGTVTVTPAGSNAINCSRAGGVDNQGACVASYDDTISVTVTATPGNSFTKAQITGDGCIAPEGAFGQPVSCSFLMDDDHEVISLFRLNKAIIVSDTANAGTDAANAAGRTTTSSGDIDCARAGAVETGDCDTTVNLGTTVTLTAIPDASSAAAISGPCTAPQGSVGDPVSCQTVLAADTIYTATFSKGIGLAVGRAGLGAGVITGPGIDCDGDPDPDRNDCFEIPPTAGTTIALTATPAAGSRFTTFTGGGCATTNPCSVLVNADVDVIATFVDDIPPQTRITRRVISAANAVKFRFTSSEPGSTFLCKLDARPYRRCTSPKTYLGLGLGAHRFAVKATDTFGNVDPTPAVSRFTLRP